MSGSDDEGDLVMECFTPPSSPEPAEIPAGLIAVRGNLAHDFEPLARNHGRGHQQRAVREVLDDEARYRGRRDNVEKWCTCKRCIVMDHFTDLECRCCREIPQTLDVAKNDDVLCVTQINDFQQAILNPLTLRLAWETYTQHYRKAAKSFNERGNEKYRYVAYRQLVRLCWGYLGKEVRVYTPTCAHYTIDNAYPDDQNRYKGTVILHDADDDSDEDSDSDDEDEQI